MRSGAFSSHFLHPGSRWRLGLVAVLAVAAVVVGLFTMHSMTGTSSHHETGSETTGTPSVTAHDHAGDAAPRTVAAALSHPQEGAFLSVVCDESCQMGCIMAGLICTLGLLAVLASVLLPPLASAVSAIGRIPRRVVGAALIAVAPPRPPSLTALSISRT